MNLHSYFHSISHLIQKNTKAILRIKTLINTVDEGQTVLNYKKYKIRLKTSTFQKFSKKITSLWLAYINKNKTKTKKSQCKDFTTVNTVSLLSLKF